MIVCPFCKRLKSCPRVPRACQISWCCHECLKKAYAETYSLLSEIWSSLSYFEAFLTPRLTGYAVRPVPLFKLLASSWELCYNNDNNDDDDDDDDDNDDNNIKRG